MSRKVFTAGEVLAAADVNSFLMDQTVMSFAGTAARGSAIGTATEGMYTHLEDSDKLEFWNGSAWVSPFGLTLIRAETFTTASVITANNVFSTEFTSYYATLELTSASAGGTVTLQYSDNTSAITGANYNFITNTGTFSATMVVGAISNGTSIILGVVATGTNAFDFDFMNISAGSAANNPMLMFRKTGGGGTGGFTSLNGGASYAANTKTTGFGLTISAGTMTGTIKIYGKRS